MLFRLCISQIREAWLEDADCGVFGIVDGGLNPEIPARVQSAFSQHLRDVRSHSFQQEVVLLVDEWIDD